MVKLEAGKYIIVDPCYVLEDSTYNEMVDTIWNSASTTDAFEYNGHTMVVFGTAYGDGSYANTANNTKIAVDSGQIAIIPTAMIDPSKIDSCKDYSVVIDYKTDFFCEDQDSGMLNFGNVIVDTKEEDDEDDYWEDDEDEDEDDED